MKKDKLTFLQELKNCGLQEYEAKAYYTLLTDGNLNAKEISKISEIPQPKVYSILAKLTKDGFCARVPGKKSVYKALQPKIAFSCIVNEIEEKQTKLSYLINELEDIYRAESKKPIDDYIEILTNNQQIHERFVDLLSNVQFEAIAFVKPPFSHQGNKKKLEEQENAVNRNENRINIRVIYEIPTREAVDFQMPHIKRSVESGENARMIENLPLKMYVFDERYVLMTLNNSDNTSPDFTMIVIEHPDLAIANKMLFEYLWKEATPYSEFLINNPL